MKPWRAISAFCALCVAVSVLTSCQKSFHQQNERYIFVATNISLPYWQEAQSGFMDAARVLGVKTEFTGPAGYSPEDQLKMFQQAVASRPSGILVSPARPETFKDDINLAIQQGIPVICVDSDSPESRRNLFIGTDNFRAGLEMGKRMATILRGRGLVAVISIPGQFNLDERYRGVLEAFGKFPGIQITKMIDDNGDPRSANDQVSALVVRKEKLDGILGLNASGGPGAAEALHRAGLSGKISIVAMDKEPETLDWIKRGVIAVAVAQKPYTMSFYGLKFLDDLHHNVVREFRDWRTAPASPLPTLVDTGTSTIDEQNVEVFVTALAMQRKLL
jgi:ribose transport system substrate-binding protein